MPAIILVGIATRNQEGVAAALFNTLAYALMNIGAFTIVALISRKGDQKTHTTIRRPGFKQPVWLLFFPSFFCRWRNSADSGLLPGSFSSSGPRSNPISSGYGHRVINSAVSVYTISGSFVMYMKEHPDDWLPVAMTSSAVSVMPSLCLVPAVVSPDLLINLARNSPRIR